MSQESFESIMRRMVVRCWADVEFKARLLVDPAAVLREAGVEVPCGIQLRVLEDTAQAVHLVIPARPAELTDDALDAVAGGGRLGALFSRAADYAAVNQGHEMKIQESERQFRQLQNQTDALLKSLMR